MTNEAEIQICIEILRETYRDALLPAIMDEEQIRTKYGKASPRGNGAMPDRVVTSTKFTPGKDLYGRDKSTEVRYFECSGCERSIAGNRFAAHVARCGGSRRR